MKNRKHKWRSKTESFQIAIKVWVCKSCYTRHEKEKPTECSHCHFNDFYYFASKFEANRFAELSMLQTAGQIKDLQTQVAFPIKVNGVDICKYVADFTYKNAQTGEAIIEDTKGHEKAVTDLFKIKRKLVGALYGFDIKPIYQSKTRRK